MSLAAKGKKCTKSRQTNTSYSPTKTISKNVIHPLKCQLEIKLVFTEKIDIFKELTPRSRTYELRDQGKKKEMTKIKTNKHLTLSYKNCLQKRHTSP